MRRFAAPLLIVIFIVVELILALYGPMAFVQKPSVVVANPFSYGIDQTEVDDVFAFLQKALAQTKLFRVISHDLIEDYYFEKQDDPDFSLDRWLTFNEYRELATELEIERIAVCTISPGAETVSIGIMLRRTEGGEAMDKVTYICADVPSFLEGRAADGTTFDVVRDFRIQTKGIGIFDNLFFAFLVGQLALAICLAMRKTPDLLNQILLFAGVVLGLFAFVYAKNAGMEYVQRFIAEEGQISLADSTATEQLYTAIRFLPLLIVNLFLYISMRNARTRSDVAPLSTDTKRLKAPLRVINDIASRWGLGCAFLSGFLAAVTFPSFISLRGFPALSWVALIPLFLAIVNARKGRGIFYGITYGAVFSLITNYWHGTYSYVSLAFTVLICCVLYSLFFLVFVPVVHRRRWGFLFAPVIWVVFEYSRSLFYVGYPWGLIGATQYLYRPIIQIADITGIWGVSFLMVLLNASMAWALSGIRPRMPHTRSSRYVPVFIAAGALILVLLYGVIRPVLLPRSTDTTMRLVLAQQNTDPRKHDYRLSLDTLEELTEAAIAESLPIIPDLIVWPEGGLKTDIRYWLARPGARGAGPELVEQALAFQRELGTWLVTGTQDHTYVEEGDEDEEVRRNFNSSVLFDNRGEIQAFYHKMHLVPFTEHFPYKEQLPWLTKLLDKFDTSNWLQGDERTIFSHPKARFFTPICFEDIFPDDVRKFVRDGADLIVNISNDYWSLTPVEGKQHAVHAMFRAVENRRPMVRATASGLTTYITPTGKLSSDPPEYYVADYMIVDIPIVERGMTVYTRYGDWFAKACGIAGIIMILGLLCIALVKRDKRPTT